MKEKINLINSNTDPLILFKKWFDEAKQREVNDPNAMNLATISENLKPSSRMVLLKSFDKNGFVFYTNLKSKKGNSIIANPQVALNIYWKSIKRQIRIEGIATLVSDNKANEYFNSRLDDSKISAWASKQSSKLNSRDELENRVKEYSQKYKGKIIPRPNYWSGFIVNPIIIEFWQHMSFRLHDRVEYKKKGNSWSVKRLYP